MQPPQRANSFDDVRLIAAFAVLFAHSVYQTGGDLRSVNGFALGTFAVLAFFSISGYLVAGSWAADPRVIPFLMRRALRIGPAFAAVTFVLALVVGPLISTWPATEYFADSRVRRYLTNVLMLGAWYLPGVFEQWTRNSVVNGPIWTIPGEVGMYVIFCVLAFACGRWAGLVGLAGTLGFAVVLGDQFTGNPHYDAAIPQWGAHFFVGALIYQFRKRPWFHTGYGALALALTLLLPRDFMQVMLPVVFPYFVICCGMSAVVPLRSITRRGDFSYGLYLWAWPTQQCIVYVTQNQLPWLASFAASVVVTGVLAYLSWHAVEKPALALKRELRPQTSAVGKK